jgi:hypothetical protein
MRKLLLTALGLVLAAPAPAFGQDLYAYEQLAKRDLEPAPLVLTRVPRALAPLERTVSTFGTRRGYGLRLEGTSATLVLTGGVHRTLAGQLREERVRGLRERATRVRGQRAYAFTGPRERALVWRERGRVYWLATGTPRSVSAAELRAAAAGLDPLQGVWIGVAGDPDYPVSASALVTARTVTARVDWSVASCRRAGQATSIMTARRGNAFSFAIDEEGWTGTVTGTVGANVDFDVRATGVFDGLSCDTGPLQISATPAGQALRRR